MDAVIAGGTQKEKRLFYIDEKFGLCQRKLNGNLLSPPQSLLEDALPDFDAVCDKHGRFHVLLQDRSGSIVYLRSDKDAWQKYTVLSSKNEDTSNKQFRLAAISDAISLFYILPSKGQKLLVHQIVGSTQTPEVVDVLDSKNPVYTILCDDFFNTHIYYSGGGALKYTVFRWSEKAFSQPTVLANAAFTQICAQKTEAQAIKLCLICPDSLLYARFDTGESIASFTKIPLPATPAENLGMFSTAMRTLLFWQSGQKLYYARQNEGTPSFSAPTMLLTGSAIPSHFRIREGSNSRSNFGFIENGRLQLLDLFETKHAQPFAGEDIQTFADRHASEFDKIPQPAAPQHVNEAAKLETQLAAIYAQLEQVKKNIKEIKTLLQVNGK